MTKTKPATPLPWQNSRVDECIVYDRDGDFVCESGARNAAYIAHAANAYPRLVEALRDAAGRLDIHGAFDSAQDAYALLRELGDE